MKKLLLAGIILAMSTTAMATNTSLILDTAVTDTLTVSAKYVKPITVSLNKSTINFGDVYTDSIITVEAVSATITGEEGETFAYSVTSDGTLALLTGNISGSAQTFTTGSATLNFNVGLDTANLTADTDVSETVTISVNYDAIADTTTS